MLPTAAAARPSSLCFLPAPGPFPAFQFFLFRHAAPSFPSFSFPFLSRSTLFLLPLCLLFSFAPTGPSALPFRTSSDFRFSQLPVRFVPFFLPIPPLFSAPFPARPAVLPSTIPALPVSVSRLLGLCFLFSCPVSCSPASVSRPPGPCFPSASPHFLPRAGGGLRARLTIGNKFPAIAFLFC